MGVKLGSGDVSFRLGSATPAKAYLGSQEVYSAAATLYFDGAVDDDWTEVGNWWLDDEHTQAAGRLPAAADSVVATASITASGQTVVDFTMNDPNGDGWYVLGTLTVTGMATLNGFTEFSATLTGDATFNDNAFNVNIITGTAIFNGNTSNSGDGTVGNATFNDNSVNFGTVTGTATFNDSACNDAGTAGTFVPDPPPSC